MRAKDQGPLDGTEKNGNPLASLHFDVSKVERKPSVTLLFTSHTSLVSVTRRFGAGNVAGGRLAARRASRLKDPCDFPSKTGADVAHRVSGGYPPEAHAWRFDDVSGAPSTSRSSRIPARDTDHKFSPKTTVPRELKLFVCLPNC